MKLLQIITSSIYQIVALIFFLAFLLGVLNIHFSDKKNYCEMTYMYEYPQFVKISMDENKEFPQYGLYAYSEGRYTERARKMWFDGVPVLFLPGNSGSHMQARSLASVALRMAISRGYEFHFDYFTISYNEELSGLYGGVLQRQTKFAAACIDKILSLYKPNKYTKSVPTTVIVIGHSMGGLIAKRLLAYPSTVSSANLSIALAAPLAAPAINFDFEMDGYYSAMEAEWERLNSDVRVKETKMLIGFGGGARDLLIPAGLTASNDSEINALTTSIPGVWVSTEHVTIVWCRQLVIAINKYLFSIMDPRTEQLVPDKKVQMALARQYFVANRSMFLNPDVVQPNATMQADAFWYEDNRRIYQISRPEIDRMTYLMIRLVSYPQNRFVAIESINLDDKDWIFGCNAQYTHNTYRYCKQGTSLSELSRWTGAATNFGKRKLATIHLHDLIAKHPDWSHVVVKVSPTKRPVTLNVDINDHASREITIDVPSFLPFTHTVVKETEANSVYYELTLRGFNAVWQAYLLRVEPAGAGCGAGWQASAELRVPWAPHQEYYHYFTHLKTSPMKLRLYKTHPNVTRGQDTSEYVKVILLLDPQCKFTISVSSSWYHVLAQSVRAFAPVLIAYVGGAALLIAKSVLMSLHGEGTCLSIHGALRSDDLKPYAPLVFVRVLITLLLAFPIGGFILDNASAHNYEIQYFIRSIMVLPAYFVALGLLNVAAAGVLFVLVFSSQLTYRMLVRLLWRGPALAERVAIGLQKVPMVVSASLITLAPLSCGGAALAAGAAFYAFMISKMYEEYLEDYFYKLAAKYASRFCRAFKRKNKKKDKIESEQALVPVNTESVVAKTEDNNTIQLRQRKSKTEDIAEINDEKEIEGNDENKVALVNEELDKDSENNQESNEDKRKNECNIEPEDVDLMFSDINFHMMMFILWAVVTIVNVPALLTWARNFKYSMVLKPDSSRYPGLILSICSTCIWQMDGPRKNLKNYNLVAGILFVVAVIVLTLGPLSVTYVNYGVTFAFAIITMQELFDTEEIDEDSRDSQDPAQDAEVSDQSLTSNEDSDQERSENDQDGSENDRSKDASENDTDRPNECDPCNENRIYNVFKNLRDKFSFSEE